MQFQTLINTLKYYLGPNRFKCSCCGDFTDYQRLYLTFNESAMFVGDSENNLCPTCAESLILRTYQDSAPTNNSYCHICNNVGKFITVADDFGFNAPTCIACAEDILVYGNIERAFGNVYAGRFKLNEAGAIIFT